MVSKKNMNNIKEEQEEEQCQSKVKGGAPSKSNNDVKEKKE